EVTPFEASPERRQVVLKVDATRAPAGLVRDLASVVKEFPGEPPVFVAISTSQGETTLALGPDYRVKPEPDFFAEVKSLLGEAAVARCERRPGVRGVGGRRRRDWLVAPPIRQATRAARLVRPDPGRAPLRLLAPVHARGDRAARARV